MAGANLYIIYMPGSRKLMGRSVPDLHRLPLYPLRPLCGED